MASCEILASAAGTLPACSTFKTNSYVHGNSHMAAVVTTAEIVLQLRAEHAGDRLILYERRLGPVTRLTTCRTRFYR